MAAVTNPMMMMPQSPVAPGPPQFWAHPKLAKAVTDVMTTNLKIVKIGPSGWNKINYLLLLLPTLWSAYVLFAKADNSRTYFDGCETPDGTELSLDDCRRCNDGLPFIILAPNEKAGSYLRYALVLAIALLELGVSHVLHLRLRALKLLTFGIYTSSGARGERTMPLLIGASVCVFLMCYAAVDAASDAFADAMLGVVEVEDGIKTATCYGGLSYSDVQPIFDAQNPAVQHQAVSTLDVLKAIAVTSLPFIPALRQILSLARRPYEVLYFGKVKDKELVHALGTHLRYKARAEKVHTAVKQYLERDGKKIKWTDDLVKDRMTRVEVTPELCAHLLASGCLQELEQPLMHFTPGAGAA